jgi:hypothetical protein
LNPCKFGCLTCKILFYWVVGLCPSSCILKAVNAVTGVTPHLQQHQNHIINKIAGTATAVQKEFTV